MPDFNISINGWDQGYYAEISDDSKQAAITDEEKEVLIADGQNFSANIDSPFPDDGIDYFYSLVNGSVSTSDNLTIEAKLYTGVSGFTQILSALTKTRFLQSSIVTNSGTSSNLIKVLNFISSCSSTSSENAILTQINTRAYSGAFSSAFN